MEPNCPVLASLVLVLVLITPASSVRIPAQNHKQPQGVAPLTQELKQRSPGNSGLSQCSHFLPGNDCPHELHVDIKEIPSTSPSPVSASKSPRNGQDEELKQNTPHTLVPTQCSHFLPGNLCPPELRFDIKKTPSMSPMSRAKSARHEGND